MKRLLRKWLKRQIIKAYGDIDQQTFDWIYNGPISTWKDKLFCIKNARCGCQYFIAYKDIYDWMLGREHLSSMADNKSSNEQ